MMHFSCDLCGKELPSGVPNRYVVKMEVYAAQDPREVTDADLDTDHLEQIGALLDELEATDEPPALAPACRKFRYDLCSACHGRFLRDPLNREAAKFDFSEN